MRIEELDHLVLTVTDIDRTRAFYERVLGMETLVFGEGRQVAGCRRNNWARCSPSSRHPMPQRWSIASGPWA